MSQLHHSGQFLPSKSSEWKLTVGWDIFMSSVGNKKSRPFLSRSSTWRTMMMKMMKVKTMNVQGGEKDKWFLMIFANSMGVCFFWFCSIWTNYYGLNPTYMLKHVIRAKKFLARTFCHPDLNMNRSAVWACTNRRGQVSNPFYKWTSFHYRTWIPPL